MAFRYGFLLALSAVPSLCTAASSCVTASLASYDALGTTGCTIGAQTVSAFTLLSGQTGATPIDPSTVTVVPTGGYSQVQRMGNPLISNLLIPTGSRDTWSMSVPANDAQFATAYSDPYFARFLNAIYGISIPAPPRNDLALLTSYSPPVAAIGTNAGPEADLLRLIAGFLDGAPYNVYLLGDGVNTNDVPFKESFPYVALAQSARGRRHIDPGEAGCTMGAGAACATN